MTLSRRTFIRQLGAVVASPLVLRLPRLPGAPAPAPARLAVIADLHHGLAPDALSRFRAFAADVARRRNLDAVLQLGDFVYSDDGSTECLDVWRTLPEPRLSVLGNHDMDRCDKDTAIKANGMPARYWSRVIGGYRFIALDLNHFKKDGALIAYANGNYFTDGATHNWADPEQLAWLGRELAAATEPVVILSHQPLGIVSPTEQMPAEQREVFDVIDRAPDGNPRSSVVACISGHLHVDRLEHVGSVPCLCVNSASYFWYEGMRAYTQPLYAFLEFTGDGMLIVDGRSGAFVEAPPAASDNVAGRSGSIVSRRESLASVR